MISKTVPAFVSGVHNLIDPENIPRDAAKNAENFFTQDGRTVLVGGRINLGPEGTVGSTTGIHIGYTGRGERVLYCKMGTIIKYFDGTVWANCITGLTEDAEYSFANYSSLAGAFTYINGVDGYWKVVNTNPGSPISVYDPTKNFKGYIIIDRGRTLLWNRQADAFGIADPTGLYGSHIDTQLVGTQYTFVNNEAIGVAPGPAYAGTLAFKGGNPFASAFGVTFVSTVAAGTETFVDNQDGTLTSNFNGTGTINYATGAYSITFSDVTLANVTSDYTWEDSNVDGITDFTHATPRVEGEGFVFPQDEGGDPIMNVLIGQDGAYYSVKQKSAYRLALSDDDSTATNEVYRKDLGLPFWRAAVSTSKGIIFINTANPTKPEMTLLTRNKFGTEVEPAIVFPHFKFADFTYDEASFSNYDRWVMVFCKQNGSENNDRILLCNLAARTVDIIGYNGKGAVQDGSALYMGDSLSKSVYQIFSGFDDMGLAIDAFWEGKDDLDDSEDLKKFRKLRFKGHIDPDQLVGVYINPDNQGYFKVGSIWGGASYVNYSESQAIGANFVGQSQVGGDDIVNAYLYLMEIKVRTGKYRQLSIKLVPEGIGYFDFEMIMRWDMLLFESRLPSAYRQKQSVSLDGQQTDQ